MEERNLDEFCELRQRACPVRVEIAQMREQLASNKVAMDLAANNLDFRLQGMNHIKEQLTRQANETIRREEVVLMLDKLTTKFDLQLDTLGKLLGAVTQRENKVILMLGLTLLGLAGNFALQFLLHVSRHP